MKDDVIFGVHAAKQMLDNSPDKILEVWVQSGKAAERLGEEIALVKKQGIPIQSVEKQKLDAMCDDGNHQGLVLRCKALEQKNEKDLDAFLKKLMAHDQIPLLLVLDNITDPHNLGACLRSAAAAGVNAVIIPKDKSAGINPTVRKVAAGAADTLDIFVVTNLARSLDKLKDAGIWLVGTAIDERAQNLYQCDLSGAIAIVMGSEGQGLRRLTQEKCDFLCYLPMLGAMQSLNVSVATGICLFEALRQRKAFV
jgi:23S rRNA (guanosine2251-2'-O)-methyltransferase